MSLKLELETQAAALKAYDEQDFETALQIFETIADTSKIHTNIGLIYATLGEHELAVNSFNAATELDQYLAVAYFQCGVSNFLLGRFDFALKDFEEALLYLRGNQNINYEQLGLKFKLYSAEVLFNQGLSRIYLGDQAGGVDDLRTAQSRKVTDEHNVIDDAIRDQGEEYTVFSIPVGILYRPSETKLKNAKTKDYLGKAKLISASDANDMFTTFTGVTRFNQGKLPSGAPLSELNRQPTLNNKPSPDLGGRGLGRATMSQARVESTPAPDMEKKLPEVKPLRTSGGDPGLKRSVTISAPKMGGRMRGASVQRLNLSSRRPSSADGPVPSSPIASLTRQFTQLTMRSQAPPPILPRLQSDGTGNPRLTEIYDDYLGAYEQEEEPAVPVPVPVPGASRVAAWATRTAPGAPAAPSRAVSPGTRIPPSSFGGSASTGTTRAGGGGLSLRRKLTRKINGSISLVRGRNLYEDEEEEGYASGDYEDGAYELTKIRVKINYQGEVRGMTLSPEVGFEGFMKKVADKFSRSRSSISLKFKDEDGGQVSLRDDSDYDLALETARESAKGKPEGKLEVWCVDQ